MSSPCRVSLIINPEDQCLLVEDAANPDEPLFMDDEERCEIEPLVQRVRPFLLTQKVSVVDLRIDRNLSYERRTQLLDGVFSLLRQALGLPQPLPRVFISYSSTRDGRRMLKWARRTCRKLGLEPLVVK